MRTEYKVTVEDNGDTRWRNIEGKLHREGGKPAVECSDGERHWYVNGKNHREDGPAVECNDGNRFWYINGKLHREDGPATEYVSGERHWYIEGKELTEEEFNNRNAIEMTLSEICKLLGKDIKIIKEK